MAVRCADSDLKGEKGISWPPSLWVDAEKERSLNIDQTWMFESGDPESRKLEDGSAAKHVMG